MGSRFFPTIKVIECRAKLFPIELPHHKFGIGVQPLIRLEDAEMDYDGNIAVEDVTWPSSQDVKNKLVALLQNSSMPNYHLHYTKWKESLEKGQFERRESPLRWPTARQEDVDTGESGLEDTDGKL